MSISKKAAQKVVAIKRKFRESNGLSELIEDIAQDVVADWYELREFDRPQSENEFEAWAYEKAKLHGSDRSYGHHPDKEISPDIHHHKMGSLTETFSWYDIYASGSIHHVQQETQFLHVYLQDILRSVSRLPPTVKAAFMRYLDHGDVVEYAREHELSLFDAMYELKKARVLMKRITDDFADEKKFSEEVP